MRKYYIDIPIYTESLEIIPIEFMQGDIGGEIVVSLLEQDLNKLILENCEVHIIYEKSNKEIIQNIAKIKEDNILLEIKNNILDLAGKIKCQLRIYKEGNRLTTHIFQITCKKILNYEGAIDAYDKFDIIQTIINIESEIENLKLRDIEIEKSLIDHQVEIENMQIELKELEVSDGETEVKINLIQKEMENQDESLRNIEVNINLLDEEKEEKNKKGVAGGYPGLNQEGKISPDNIPELNQYPEIIISKTEPTGNIKAGTFWLQPLEEENV